MKLSFAAQATDRKQKIGQPWAAIYQTADKTGVEGHIYTPQGIVTVEGSNGVYFALRMIVNGIIYSRVFDECPSKRYAITLAKKFATQMELISKYEALEAREKR